MRPNVGAGLVEADSGGGAGCVRSELDAHLDRGRIARIGGLWAGAGSPDRAGAVHVDRRPGRRLLQVAAVIHGPGLDRRRGIAMGDP